MKVYIKNMVCNRCISAVTSIFEKEGLVPQYVALGEVDLAETTLSKMQLVRLDKALSEIGFERLDDQKQKAIEKVKNMVVNRIHHSSVVASNENWSDILTAEIPMEYGYLSSLFSSVEGITIEQYIIQQKIERVKELLYYNEMSLSEIAYLLAYSSVAHLSAQFKKVMGMTPTEFKKLRPSRKSLDSI